MAILAFVRTIRMTFLLLVFTLLTACWDFHDARQLTYGSTIGVDYRNNAYTMYAQSLNLANIAKRTGQQTKAATSIVGISQGETVAESMFHLYQSEQEPVYWGHISSIVFTRQALENVTIESLVDSINRYRDLRYNVWVFGTDEPIERILEFSPYFGYSPYDSRLMKPDQTFRQFSDIAPIYLNRFVSDYFERSRTLLFPELALDDSTWTEGGKKVPTVKLNGYYVFASEKLSGKLTMDQAIGLRYMNERTHRTKLTVFKNEQPAALLVLVKPKVKIRHSVSGGIVRFDVGISMEAYVDEMLQEVPESFLVQQIRENVEEAVQTTFEEGKRINADVYNLTNHLYRFHYQTWKRNVTDQLDMNKVDLRRVRVSVLIRHSGKYKARLK
ncbi:Ger(x)C family spore germination protein [Cohnella sp. AR92]|uniref:Ger(x)C family spore germination protein n=1 Tax=Cohnella sp. AR92 TaxID=648716 RepID=UPI0013155AD4|nr:Ger(x)C family spore germination protein [Cohnella sp. AR92]